MPNDGYAIQNGKLITKTIITSSDNAEVCRFTISENINARLNTLCLIQSQTTISDGYAYWLDVFAVREPSGNAYIIGDGYGSVHNISGSTTEMTIDVSTDGYDVVFKSNQTGIGVFRLSTFTTTYQVENII